MMLIVLIVAAIAVERFVWPSFAFPTITTLWIAIDLTVYGREAHRQMRKFVLIAVGIAGLLLYASVAGFLPIDIYRLGFSPWLPIVLALVGAIAAGSRPAVALLILVVLVARDLSLLRSSNLFDYLVDPAIFAVAVVYGIVLAAAMTFRKSQEN